VRLLISLSGTKMIESRRLDSTRLGIQPEMTADDVIIHASEVT